MIAITHPVSRNYLCPTETRQMGEDNHLVSQLDEALKNVIAKFELLAAVGNCPRSGEIANRIRLGLQDVLHDECWRAHVVACELSAEEALVKPMKMGEAA